MKTTRERGRPARTRPAQLHLSLPRRSTGNGAVPGSPCKGGFRPPSPLGHLTISLHSEECLPMRHQILLAILLGGLVCTTAAIPGQAQTLESRQDASLDYPIEVLEADPYWQPAGKWALESPLTTLGAMRALYRKLRTLPAQRLRLPVPKSPWKLTGRVGRTGDGTIYAAFGRYLYHSTDEGRSWQGRKLDNLAGTREGQPVSTGAFGSNDDYIFLAHAHRGLLPIDPESENPSYPVVISRSSDGGRTWQASDPLKHPFKKTGGDGNHIVSLGGGELLAQHGRIRRIRWIPNVREQGGMVIFRSTDSGKTWKFDSYLPKIAETGFLHLGGRRMLAAFRNESGKHDSKTVQLANSEDGGRTWHSHRPLTRMYGQAHGDLVALPGGGVVATFENRLPTPTGAPCWPGSVGTEGKPGNPSSTSSPGATATPARWC